MNNKYLYNAIIGWYDDSLEAYSGIDDEAFVRRVCERIGISEEEYHTIMDDNSEKEEWFILSNNSDCDDLSIYKFYGTAHEVYKHMQAMVLSTAARTEERRYLEVNMNSSEMEATIQWSDVHEDFRIVRGSLVTPIKEADGVLDVDLDTIPDDISWDNEMAHKELLRLNRENDAFTTVEEITHYFVKNGWNEDTTFSELSLEEATKKGYLFAIPGISKGRKYFIMNICGNVYDDKGQLVMFNIKTNNNERSKHLS